MRNKLLGTIAAVAAGAGSVVAQTPPPPMPIGPAGMAVSPSMGAPAGMGMGSPEMGGMAGPGMMGGPGMGGPGMGGPGPGGMGGMDGYGMPGYPAGIHGQQQYTPPAPEGLFGAGPDSRLAARRWLNFDYLLWFGDAQPNRFPLLTTGAPASRGVPGATSVRRVGPESDYQYNVFSGFRIETGFYCDDALRKGIYVSGFLTEQKSNITSVRSDPTGQPLFARPFINAATGQPDVLLVSFPTFASGQATAYTASQLYGAEGGSYTNLYRSCPEDGTFCSLNFLVAFRYLQLYETLRVDQTTTLLDGGTAQFDGKLYGAPATIGVVDEFEVYNRFYGGQIGLNGELRRNRWSVNGTAKLAIGLMNERLDTRGFSTISGTGTNANSVVSGGLYANANNIGRINHDELCFIPEGTVNVGYSLRSWLTTSIGYNVLYASRVARPGQQFNPTVDPALVPTSASFGQGNLPTTPRPAIVQGDYLMHGLQFSIMARY